MAAFCSQDMLNKNHSFAQSFEINQRLYVRVHAHKYIYLILIAAAIVSLVCLYKWHVYHQHRLAVS